MSNFKKFSDYAKIKDMDAKNGLAGIDYKGELSLKPAGKDAVPYKNFDPDKGEMLVASDGQKEVEGLADKGSPGITPETSTDCQKPKVKSKVVKPQKMKTEEFLQKTKDMTISELSAFLAESRGNVELTTVTDLFGNEFTPDPDQSIEYVAALILGNPILMERFVHEIVRRDGSNHLLEEFMSHNNSYEVLIDHFEEPENGLERAGKLSKMMNDRYLKNYEKFDFGNSEDNDFDFGFGESIAPGLNQVMPAPNTVPQVNNTNQNKFSMNDKAPDMAAQKPNAPNFPTNGAKAAYMGADAGHNLVDSMSGHDYLKDRMIKKCSQGNC